MGEGADPAVGALPPFVMDRQPAKAVVPLGVPRPVGPS
jgi:hypothetical protein